MRLGYAGFPSEYAELLWDVNYDVNYGGTMSVGWILIVWVDSFHSFSGIVNPPRSETFVLLTVLNHLYHPFITHVKTQSCAEEKK